MQPGGMQAGLATPPAGGFPHGLPAPQVPVQAPYESLVLNVEEARNYYTATAQLPGVRKEDIDIMLDDARTLRISAVRREYDADGSERVVQIKRAYILPKYADPDNMRADFEMPNLLIVIHKMPDLIGKKKPRLD